MTVPGMRFDSPRKSATKALAGDSRSAHAAERDRA
jgi:hypothetical protein